MKKAALLLLFFSGAYASAQSDIPSLFLREGKSLNGLWHYIIDPYETGYRNHRNWVPFDEKDYGKASAKPYYTNKKAMAPGDRVEYNFDTSPTLHVPGDWNAQDEKLLYYEGTLWYKTGFHYQKREGQRVFLHFGAANYEADVYLNGEKVGKHLGGFDPFSFDVSKQLKTGHNFLIVRVDNKRQQERVPNLTTDWWNYGGITREVRLVSVPQTFIADHFVRLSPKDEKEVLVDIDLLGEAIAGQNISIHIPEAGLSAEGKTNESGKITLRMPAKKLKRWYPKRPKLYEVTLICAGDTITDRVGFRTIKTNGADILLNGKSIFLRGISLHEEVPTRAGRAHSAEDADLLLGWAKELHCNFVRLAHYPHNVHMARKADEMGLLLWEEIPVYWGIDYENPEAYGQAVSQLKGLVQRDKNRASVIVWSVANETPETESRLAFLQNLKSTIRQIDDTRLISAALERDESPGKRIMTIPDPFAADVDLLSCNEYLGWYGSTPEICREVSWDLPSDKPFFVSEFGGGALYNYRGPKEQRWTEDYQTWLYKEQLDMLRKIPTLRGMTPWILCDFRSPRRNLPGIQDGWNRKGLISNSGFKKEAYFVLQDFYRQIAVEYDYKIRD